MNETIEERFWAKVNLLGDGGCWLWTAHTNKDGYGRLKVDGSTVLAHRWSYEALAQPIPEGLTIDHLCRVRCCVNPAHMEPVSLRANILRGETFAAANVMKSHCPRGHPLQGDNLTPSSSARGRRDCLTCNRDTTKAIKAAHEALGMTQRAYVAQYGRSISTAETITTAQQ